MRRLGRIAAAVLATLLAIAAITAVVIDTDLGHRFIADRINALRPDNGLRFQVGRIDGSIYRRAELVDVRLYDPEGLVLQVPRARLNWNPFAWFANRLQINALDVPVATFAKLPRPRDTGRNGPILPAFDIVIGRLKVDRLIVGPRVTGAVRYGRIDARADIRWGRALVDLAAVVEGSDTLRARIDAVPDIGRFDVDVHARGARSGVLAGASGLDRQLALDVTGAGDWQRWRGTAMLDVGTARIADLALGNKAGRYTLSGTLQPQSITDGKLRAMTAPRVGVNGAGTFADRKLSGTVALRSAALALEAEGAVDLARSTLDNLKVRARLLRAEALFRNMRAAGMELRAILDGPFGRFRYDYRITSPRLSFGTTGFEQARAAGQGRWGRTPPTIPVRFTAAQVTGVGNVAGGILRNLSVEGLLQITPRFLIGNDLRLRSDKLTGRINVQVDLRSGAYDVGVNGALGRYLIPGLGIVDVQSRLRVVPGPGGRGTRVVGRGVAQMVRLDNAFFRSLAGGLPRIETELERGADGILTFRNLVLTAPAIRLSGNGYRRRDGTFHFEGAGTQRSYGPLRLVLDGDIERPTLDLLFDSPNAALGLRAVRVHLDPVAEGFGFRAAGASTLGPFDGEGRILLPRGGQARIQIARLDVSGTRAAGALDIVPGGFAGRLQVAGGGLAGTIDLSPSGDMQRIRGQLTARGARLGTASLQQGRTEFDILLDPVGTQIDATATGTGLRRGALSLARFAGNVRLAGDAGEARATLAGSRGGGFQIQTTIAIAPDAYTVRAQGTVGRRPIQLQTPAVLRREGAGWRLDPTRLAFAGGTAEVSGRFGERTEVAARLARLPLAVLDIGYSGLGLGGSVSGSLSFASGGTGAPTGRMDVTIRGLTRSGLLLSSQPIDLGLSGLLTAEKAAFRAVMASGGRTIGRAQGLLSPLGRGDLVTRLAGAGLFAQLRYDGPADTLWRLTRVELFDLTGPVQIAADAGGSVANPQIRGLVRARGARIQSATTGTVLTNVAAEGRFAGSRLQIGSFSADAGRGGRVTGSGSFDVGGGRGVALDLKVDADHAVLIDTDSIGATVTGPLAFRSSGEGGTISGDVRLNNSRYRLGQATAASAVPRLNIREVNAPPGTDPGDEAPAAPWRLDVHAVATKGLMVSGLGLSSEWSTDIRIAGTPTNPAITGRADLIRGDYEFAGREFELERGVIRFGGEVPANPALDIEADASVSGLNASIRVTGVAQRPEITFASTPALPQDELLSRLLFGTSITNLSAPEALQLAAAVAALQDGGNGLNPINAVRRAAGLDRLRILPADPQTGQGTSIAAGKYVTRRLFAEIITDGQGYSATRVEYQVTRWLSLLSSISTLGRQSANVRVSKDY